MTPDEEGMEDALDRARENGTGRDTYGILAEGDGPADDAPDGEGAPSEPGDWETPSSGAPMAPSLPVSSVSKEPVQTSAAPSPTAARLKALEEAKKLAYTPVDTGVSDKDIAEAQGRDRAKTNRDAFTEAIQAWMQRRPIRFSNASEADDLVKRRQLGESAALRQRGQQLGVQEALAKALTEPKAAGGLSDFQKYEMGRDDRAAADRKEASEKRLTDRADAKQKSLEDRKRTMLSLYPEHKEEIGALADLGDAQTLQTALEGRAGRESTQTHSDQAAAEGSRRELNKQIAFEEWKSKHQNLTAEQKTQLEGIEKSDEALDTYEKSLRDTSDIEGKMGASFPRVAGSLGLKGAAVPASREGTAVALARGLEGGTARPGNVEIIQHMLPDPSDADAVKTQKMATVRQFVTNNRTAFQRAAQEGGTVLQPVSNPHVTPRAPAAPPRGAIPPNATNVHQLKSGRWGYQLPDGSLESWGPGDR